MTSEPLFLAQQAGVVDGLKETFNDILQKGLNGPELFSQVVLFILVALALKRFAYGPILRILEERQATIRQGLENAEKVKAELAAAEAQRHEIVRKANEQAAKMIEEASKTAEVQAQKRIQDAIREAEGHLAAARQAAVQERERMFQDLRRELLRLVVEATGRATGKVLTPQDQERIRNEAMAEVSSN